MSRIMYHYTSGHHLPLIYSDEKLKTTESNIGSPVPAWEPCGVRLGPDAVWVTDVDDARACPLGLAGSYFDKTEVRFTLELGDEQVLPWIPWALNQGAHPDWLARLAESCDPDRTFVVTQSIPIHQWVAIHGRSAGAWKELWSRDGEEMS